MFDVGRIHALLIEARSAQHAWASQPLAHRLGLVRRLRGLLAAHSDRLVRAVGWRDAAETLSSEVIPLADACRFLEREAGKLLAPRNLGRRGRPLWLSGARAEIKREPYGLILVLAPSNYPLFLPGVQIVQALLAGNAVLVKPAPEHTPPIVEFKSLLTQAGLVPALCEVLDENVDAARAAISAGVDKVILTGSAASGRQLLSDLAPRLIPATMELSGNGAVFVLAGAELKQVAAALAFGLRLNGGATCIAPRRVFVPRHCLPELQAHLLALLAKLPAVALSPRAHTQALMLLKDAVENGARLSAPLPDRQTNTMAPLIVTNASPELDLLRADVMAPIMALVGIDDTEQALSLDARCPYALSAAIFGPEPAAQRLAGEVRAGSVTVNDLIAPSADPRLPFGGRGESGYGVTRGGAGLLECTTIKTISTRRGRTRWHHEPNQPGDDVMFTRYLQATHGARFLDKLRASLRLFHHLRARGK